MASIVVDAKGISHEQLGMEDGGIKDDEISASSELDDDHPASSGRLNKVTTGGSWSARPKNGSQWIQVDLGYSKKITGVITQGRCDNAQWVTRFDVQYSRDGAIWQYVQNAKGFTGNYDGVTAIANLFESPIEARYVRIHPTEWHGHISMRFDILGCSGYTLDQL